MIANWTNAAQRFVSTPDPTIPDRNTQVSLPTGTASALVVHINDGLVFVDASQVWFWTDEWQAGERKVEEHIQAGRVETFDTIEDFLRTLRE